MQTLLYGAQIITQNEQDEIHKEGWILLEDDRIIGIGAGAPPEVPEGTVKRCLPGRVIMPGIVNIHTHVGGTLFKGLTEDIKGAFPHGTLYHPGIHVQHQYAGGHGGRQIRLHLHR